MSGSIHFRKDSGWWFVSWWDRTSHKRFKINRYKGERMYDKRIAAKLLAQIQGEYEDGYLRIEKYAKEQWTDVVPYLKEWIETVQHGLAPATYKDYSNSIRNYLEPFFRKFPVPLHEIQFDTITRLSDSINRSGKGKRNVLYCLHACLDYAWRSKRIGTVPPFPRIKVTEQPIKWLPEGRQMAIIEAIPQEDRPIFLFLKYHLRRPGEACALKWEDWDGEVFTIRRGISARKVVESTKTGAIHRVPCHASFVPVVRFIKRTFSPFIFINPLARTKDKNYTIESLGRIWKAACKKSGESIPLYSGLKHSTACQLVNDHGLSLSDLQTAGDWARLDSVKKYAVVEVQRRKELLEGKVVRLSQHVPKAENETAQGGEK